MAGTAIDSVSFNFRTRSILAIAMFPDINNAHAQLARIGHYCKKITAGFLANNDIKIPCPVVPRHKTEAGHGRDGCDTLIIG